MILLHIQCRSFSIHSLHAFIVSNEIIRELWRNNTNLISIYEEITQWRCITTEVYKCFHPLGQVVWNFQSQFCRVMDWQRHSPFFLKIYWRLMDEYVISRRVQTKPIIKCFWKLYLEKCWEKCPKSQWKKKLGVGSWSQVKPIQDGFWLLLSSVSHLVQKTTY